MIEHDEEQEHYEDWLTDHKEDLYKEYAEEHIDDFMDYCKNEFRQWKSTKL